MLFSSFTTLHFSISSSSSDAYFMPGLLLTFSPRLRFHFFFVTAFIFIRYYYLLLFHIIITARRLSTYLLFFTLSSRTPAFLIHTCHFSPDAMPPADAGCHCLLFRLARFSASYIVRLAFIAILQFRCFPLITLVSSFAAESQICFVISLVLPLSCPLRPFVMPLG